MDNIFIDTSIFRNETFLNGFRIKEFFRLCKEDHFQLIMPKIIVNEIKGQYKKVVKDAWEQHNEILNSKKLDVLKNYSESGNRLTKFPAISVILKEFNDKLDHELQDINAVILDYPVMDLSEIFNSYFENKYPFNKGEKKHEFPDAVAIKQLEEWCKKNSSRCIVFSKDKDFLNSQSPYFDILPDYADYLTKYLKRIDPIRTDYLDKTYNDNNAKIREEIMKWLGDELNNEQTYFTNSYEIHNINVQKAEIVDDEYQVIGMDDERIDIEILVTVNIDVEIEVDDENNAVYDSEDKRMIFLDTTTEYISEELTIPVKASFRIIDKADYDDEIKIEQYNDGKELELSSNKWDVY